MEDWSKLITINYPHGYHGDFIACLITNTKPVLSEGLTTTYTTPEVTSSFGVKNLDAIVSMHLNMDCRHVLFDDETEFARRQVNYYRQLHGEDFRQNLKEDLRWKLNHLHGVKTVFNTHYCKYQSFLPLQEVFPGSLNVYLTLENPNNKRIYDFLFEHKILHHYRNTTAYRFYRNYQNDPRDTETPIYVDRLMAEDGYTYANIVERTFDSWFDLVSLSDYKRHNRDLLLQNGYKYETLDHW